MRIKEHPTAPLDLDEAFSRKGDSPVYLDNKTDTFEQVLASRCVVTVNSSVGLEAMFFEKPVVACGQAFWAIDGIATSAPDQAALDEICRKADLLDFDAVSRGAFLDYLDQWYYPPISSSTEDVISRLNGKDAFGFWGTQ